MCHDSFYKMIKLALLHHAIELSMKHLPFWSSAYNKSITPDLDINITKLVTASVESGQFIESSAVNTAIFMTDYSNLIKLAACCYKARATRTFDEYVTSVFETKSDLLKSQSVFSTFSPTLLSVCDKILMCQERCIATKDISLDENIKDTIFEAVHIFTVYGMGELIINHTGGDEPEFEFSKRLRVQLNESPLAIDTLNKLNLNIDELP